MSGGWFKVLMTERRQVEPHKSGEGQRSLMSRERGGDHLMSGRRGKQPFKIRREASQVRREVSGASHD